jgi:hypothetical protein
MFKIKDVNQELRRYLNEFDTNIISIKKVDSKIIFEVEDAQRLSRKGVQTISEKTE